VALAITIDGIDEALSHFHYKNKQALKSRFISLIRQYYEDETAVETLPCIDTDELIMTLWDTGDDPAAIKNRRKNFTSIKSSVNKELEKLYEKGENPEGIVIGPENTFVMSDEARNKALEAFIRKPQEDGAALLGQVKDVLKVLGEMLSDSSYFHDGGEGDESGRMREIRDLIRDLSHTAGLGDMEVFPHEVDIAPSSGDAGSDQGKNGDAEIENLSPDEELVEVDEDDLEEMMEDVDDTGSGDSGDEETAELSPDEELVEVEEDDLEEMMEGVDDTGSGDSGDEETTELSPDEELVEVDEDDLEEMMEGVDDTGSGDSGDEETAELSPDEELVEVDEDDLEEVVEEIGDTDSGDSGDEETAGLSPDEELVEVDEDDLEKMVEEVGDAGPDREVFYDIDPHESSGTDDADERARLLAEQFNESLAAMDRFYNQYILIPEDNYTIGSGMSAKSANMERVVHLPPFYIGKFPVTNVLFEIFIEETGYKTTAEKVGYGTVFHGRHRGQKCAVNDSMTTYSCNSALSVKVVKGACWYQPFGPGSTLYGKRNHPVVQVSLEDAMAFAAWTGKRLPTEEEWEAAARTATGHLFPWGDEWLDDACNTEGNLVGDTTAVNTYGEFENECGIADTLGNVLEWTVTRSKEPDPERRGADGLYVAKGGSFISGSGISLPDRTMLHPHYHSNILGFRCIAC